MGKGNSRFIKLYNVFGEIESKYHLTVDELYLYSVLRRLANYTSQTIVNVDLLDQYSNIKFNSRKTENKKRIKENLLSLENKEVVNISGKVNKNNELLEVTFVEDLQEHNVKGHEQIKYKDFDDVKDKISYYIKFIVSRWASVGEGVFICSFERWGNILHMTTKTAEKYITNAIDDEVIYCNVGDYSDEQVRNGQKKRESNQYSIYPFKEKDKSSMQRKIDNSDMSSEPPTLDSGNWGKSDEYPFDTGNWIGDNDLTVDDYVLYLECKKKTDPLYKDFVADCKKKIEFIKSKNEDFKHVDGKLEKKARVKMKKMQQEQQEKLEEMYLEQAKKIIDDTKDVALLDNGTIIDYETWNKKDSAERVYYEFGRYESVVDDFVPEVYYQDIIDSEQIELHRPDENGEWDNTHKKEQREIEAEMDDITVFPY